jgi:TonB family protein
MKYLPILLLCFTTNVFAQVIDCQKLEKLKSSQTKINSRFHTFTTTEFSDMESITEMDTAMRIRATTKTVYKTGQRAGKTEIRESIYIDRINYSKSSSKDVWEFYELPPLDTTKRNKMLASPPKFENCRVVGTEILEGKSYDIIESTFYLKATTDSMLATMKTWVNWESKSIKKSEMVTQSARVQSMKTVYEYGVDIQPILKPENAIKSTLSNTSTTNLGNLPLPQKVENIPSYKAGDAKLFALINNNVEYPKSARDAKIEGTVYVGFIVETDGTVCDLIVKRGIDKECDEAAMELVKKSSGSWVPAYKLGKPIRYPYTLPIKFKL